MRQGRGVGSDCAIGEWGGRKRRDNRTGTLPITKFSGPAREMTPYAPAIGLFTPVKSNRCRTWN